MFKQWAKPRKLWNPSVTLKSVKTANPCFVFSLKYEKILSQPVLFLSMMATRCFHSLARDFLYFARERMLERSTNLACWPFEQIFQPLTSVKGLNGMLCFLSQLTWIFISGCISPSNLLFSSFIWRNVARTVNRFGLLTVPAKFLTSYLS